MTNRQVEQLLRHEGFLRSLARRLLRDTATVDDVVQETWLVALKSDKRIEQVRRGWLAGIVRNLALRVHRDRDRRDRRERAAAKDIRARPTDELCDERSLQRRIAHHVLALPELYREPILLRYYHGLEPSAIAGRLDVTASTVRTRLQRGLARVRDRLESENGGNGRALSSLLGVLAAGAAPRAVGAAPVARVAAAAVPLLVSALALHLLDESPATSRAALASAGERTRPDGLSLLAEPDGGSTVGSAGATRVRAVETALLTGVVRVPPGVDASPVSVEVSAGKDRRVRARVEANRPFRIGVDALLANKRPQELRVRATHPGTDACEVVEPVPAGCSHVGPVYLSLSRRALVPAERLEPARVRGAGDARGLASPRGDDAVRDAGAPLGGDPYLAGVAWLPAAPSTPRVVLEVSRADGSNAFLRRVVSGDARFVLSVGDLLRAPMPRRIRLTAIHPDAVTVRVDVPVSVEPGSGEPRLPFVEIDLRAGRELSGAVVLDDASPAEGSTLAVYRAGEESLFAAAQADEEGRFSVTVARDESYDVVALVEGYRPRARSVEAADEDRSDLGTLVVEPGAEITGRLRRTHGAVEDAVVRATLLGPDARRLEVDGEDADLVWTGLGPEWRTVTTRTGAGGAYRIGGLREAAYEVELLRFDAARGEVTAPGTLDFEIAAARLVFEVTAAGAPLPKARVEIGDRAVTVNDAGTAELTVAPHERYRVVARAPGHEPLEREIESPGPGATQRVALELFSDSPLASLAVFLAPRNGTVLPAVCDFELIPLDWDLAPIGRRQGIERGRYLLPGLEPGGYWLFVRDAAPASYFVPAQSQVSLRAGETAEVRLDFVAGGRVTVELRPSDVPASFWLESPRLKESARGAPIVIGEPGLLPNVWFAEGGRLVSGLLAPGSYTLHVDPFDSAYAPASVAFTCRAGETTPLAIVLARR